MSVAFTATPHKLTVDAYHDLGATGHLTKADRVELIEGEPIAVLALRYVSLPWEVVFR